MEMKNRFFTANEAFEHLFEFITRSIPDHSANYAGTKAIFNVSFDVINPEDKQITSVRRNWKESYAKLEYEWYLTGNRDPAMVEQVAKIWTDMKDDSGYVNSNYGAWWLRNDQLKKCVEILRNNPDTRRAIIVHYTPDEIDEYKFDTPCNVVLNFFVLNGFLHMTVFARSIDLVYGFCNDQYCFSRLMEDVGAELKIPVGRMHWFITNLHIYKKHWYLTKN